MEDFIELGIEGIDKVVDKHFDKVPDDALHIHTYHPKHINKLRKSSRQERSNQSTGSEDDSEEPERAPRRQKDRRNPDRPKGDMAQDPRQNSSPVYTTPASPYTIPPKYSREPPRLRPQYLPTPPTIGGGYYAPPAGGPPYSAVDRSRKGRDIDDSYYSDSFRQPPRRPKALTRRSSSYHGPRGRDYGYESPDDNTQMVQRRRRDSMSSSHKTKDSGHGHGFKEEIEKNFTKTPAGITGGVVGAVIGGWAAKKAQAASGKDSKYGKTSNAALTALGAAVGGLAVNAIVDRWQDKKEEAARKENKGENKFGSGSEDESDGGRGERRDKRDREDRDRRVRRDRGDDRWSRRSRRDSRDSDDSGYTGERGGKGYAPYN